MERRRAHWLQALGSTRGRISIYPDSDYEGLDVAVAATCTWTGEKKTKIQSAPTSENPCRIAGDVELSNKGVHVVDQEQDWLKQLVDCDWNFNDLKLATDQYVKQMPSGPPDSYDTGRLDEQQLKELNSRLALFRIRAYKVPIHHFAFLFALVYVLICTDAFYLLIQGRRAEQPG